MAVQLWNIRVFLYLLVRSRVGCEKLHSKMIGVVLVVSDVACAVRSAHPLHAQLEPERSTERGPIIHRCKDIDSNPCLAHVTRQLSGRASVNICHYTAFRPFAVSFAQKCTCGSLCNVLTPEFSMHVIRKKIEYHEFTRTWFEAVGLFVLLMLWLGGAAVSTVRIARCYIRLLMFTPGRVAGAASLRVQEFLAVPRTASLACVCLARDYHYYHPPGDHGHCRRARRLMDGAHTRSCGYQALVAVAEAHCVVKTACFERASPCILLKLFSSSFCS